MIIVSNLPVESRQAAQAAEQEHGGARGHCTLQQAPRVTPFRPKLGQRFFSSKFYLFSKQVEGFQEMSWNCIKSS